MSVPSNCGALKRCRLTIVVHDVTGAENAQIVGGSNEAFQRVSTTRDTS